MSFFSKSFWLPLTAKVIFMSLLIQIVFQQSSIQAMHNMYEKKNNNNLSYGYSGSDTDIDSGGDTEIDYGSDTESDYDIDTESDPDIDDEDVHFSDLDSEVNSGVDIEELLTNAAKDLSVYRVTQKLSLKKSDKPFKSSSRSKAKRIKQKQELRRKQMLCIFLCILIVGSAILVPSFLPFLYIFRGSSNQNHLSQYELSAAAIQNSAQFRKFFSDPSQSANICLVTLSTPNRKSFAQQVEKNQVAYARHHEFDFFKSDQSLYRQRPEEWSKIIAIYKSLEQTKSKWILWIDDDIVITNPSISLESLIKKYGDEKNIIIAHDARKDFGVPLNNGIFLIRNCDWSKKFLERVWQKGHEWNFLTRGESLLEQVTMTRLWAWESDIYKKTAVIEQREMNSFLRCNSYNDPEYSKWQPGDFVAHVTGMPESIRGQIISDLINQGDFPLKKPDMPC